MVVRGQTAVVPPSTINSIPLTKLESSEARNRATVAILLRAAVLSPWDQRLPRVHRGLRLVVEQLLLFWRDNLARGQHVDPDPAVLQLGQPHAGVGMQRSLARRVHTPVG